LARLPGFTLEQPGPPRFVRPGAIDEEDRQATDKGLERAREVLTSGDHDLVTLDEINVVLQLGLAGTEDVLRLLDEKADGTEVILTGRWTPLKLIGHTDLVSRVEAIEQPV